MNLLYIDIDSLRPDHLGCYGYHRNTTPNLDALAAEGLRFRNCYTPDAPCLPSRTAMTTGMFGVHTGVVNHGGERSVLYNYGPERDFSCGWTKNNWAAQFQNKGWHTVAFSPFAQRHGAWHWYAGFMEIHNTGGGGMETADRIAPQVNDWLDRNKNNEKPFFMWVNVWDPHTPYRTPMDDGNPFADDPLPAWYTESVRREHWQKPGPHSPQEVNDFDPRPEWLYGSEPLLNAYPAFPQRQPEQIRDMADARKMFDGYDTGVAYADKHIGAIIAKLKALGLYEDTAIIVSSDHGENLGELWVYGDHQTADQHTCRVPMIVRWPGVTDARAGQEDNRLMYAFDMAATSLDLAGGGDFSNWDGSSFANTLSSPHTAHRDHLVLSQMAWCAQRAARWDHYICIRTWHDAFHDYPEYMLFDLHADPHEQHNLADARPDLLAKGMQLLETWTANALETSRVKQDPLDTVLAEDGPLHVRGAGTRYLQRLRETGREAAAQRLAQKHSLE